MNNRTSNLKSDPKNNRTSKCSLYGLRNQVSVPLLIIKFRTFGEWVRINKSYLVYLRTVFRLYINPILQGSSHKMVLLGCKHRFYDPTCDMVVTFEYKFIKTTKREGKR